MSNSVQQATRSEIPENMKWDLSDLYASLEDWDKDFAQIAKKLNNFNQYQGKLANCAENIKLALENSDALDRLLEKLYTFAHLLSDEDMTNSENLSYLDKISSKFAEISGATAWFTPELLSISDNKMDEYINSDTLSFYKRSLDEILRAKNHILSDKEEALLGKASEVLSSSSKTFSMLNNADIKFAEIEDEDGNKVELTHGNYIKFLESDKQDVRKAAFNAMYDAFYNLRNTLASTLEATVKRHILSVNLRGYDSALSAALYPDNVDIEVYDNLIETVNEKLPSLHNYYNLRKKVFKVDSLNAYDLHTSLIPEFKIDVPWDTACNWIREAFKPLGKEYCDILEQAFDKRWIDVLESKGKRSGAYSSGCYDSKPFVLMNYNNTLSEVFTLAHELGHSMHSYYSKEYQEYHYADYKIFVAEVASTTNELLLHDYLMKTSKDENLKQYLLNHYCDSVRSTLFRQTMFAEFEKTIHSNVEKGLALTADSLSEWYYNLNLKYHGNAVILDKKLEMEWSRIPHFYYNFYVYKYATGHSAACILSKNILSGNTELLDAYMGFLKAGSSKNVLDIMKDAGVDLTTSEPTNIAIKEFDNTVTLLEQSLL